MDVTYKELMIHPVEEREIIKTYEEYSDFIAGPTLKVYSLNEMVIEKACALFSPARNEPRDLFDLDYLISEVGSDLGQLVQDIDQKLKFKGSSFEERKGEFLKKEKRLEKLWNQRLAAQLSKQPQYETVFRSVKRALRQAGLLKSG